MRIRCALLAGLALTVAAHAANAQGLLIGSVTDSSRSPIPGLEIVIEGTNVTSRTNANGLFRLQIPAGTHSALFRKVGYKPLRLKLEVKDREGVHADVMMIRQIAQELDTVVVQAPPARIARTLREGFIERRALAMGKFLDSTELRRSDGRHTSDILRSMGVRIVPYASCKTCIKQYRATSALFETCWVSVIFDGQVIYRAGSAGEPPDFSKEFLPTQLEGIEFYRGSGVMPVEFSGFGEQCGVLVLWSRRS